MKYIDNITKERLLKLFYGAVNCVYALADQKMGVEDIDESLLSFCESTKEEFNSLGYKMDMKENEDEI